MNTPRNTTSYQLPSAWRPIVVGIAALFMFITPLLQAQVVFKANNEIPLTEGGSWVGGLAPTPGAIAVWDNRVTGPNNVSMGLVEATWGGIQILNPGGPVTISDSRLLLGFHGVDLSAATQNLTINSLVDFSFPQRLQVGANRSLTFTGIPTRANRAGLQFSIAPGGEARMDITGMGFSEFLMVNEQIFATYNGIDFAAQMPFPDALIIAASTDPFLVADYTPNPGAAVPNIGNTLLLDFVNDASFGARIGTSPIFWQNLRFNAPRSVAGSPWRIETPGGRTLTVATVLITENVGPHNVRSDGDGFLRISSTTPGGMLIFQNNTQGDFIIENLRGFTEQGVGRLLTKMGPGRVIINTGAFYTGPTYVMEGTLQFRRAVNNRNVFEVIGGALELDGATVQATAVNVHPRGRLAGRGVITGFTPPAPAEPVVATVTNNGDLNVNIAGTTLRIDGNVVNHGTITVSNGAHIQIDGTFTNHGTINYSGGFASLPVGWVNHGAVIRGREGPPPSPIEGLRITSVTRVPGVDGALDEVHVTVPSHIGFLYYAERSFTLLTPTVDHTRLTTAFGVGADTHVSNDPAQGTGTNHGAGGVLNVRNHDAPRMRIGIARFDTSQLTAQHLLDEARLQLIAVGGATAPVTTFEVWGLTDETLDNWIESGAGGVTYDNFGGFYPTGDPNFVAGMPNPRADRMVRLGEFSFGGGLGTVSSSTPAGAPLGDFLRGNTNNVVTLVFFKTARHVSADYFIATKENADVGRTHPMTGATVMPPTLIIPTQESHAQHQVMDPWTRLGADVPGTGAPRVFTDRIPADRERVFYRVNARVE